MCIDLNYFYLILGMGIVTYLTRMIPASFLAKRQIPELFVKFLNHIPAAVLAALLFPSILMPEGSIAISSSNHILLAALISLPVAYKSKNMFLTVILGMIIMVLLRRLT